jgi:uncharacterized protein (TIGR03437 family)
MLRDNSLNLGKYNLGQCICGLPIAPHGCAGVYMSNRILLGCLIAIFPGAAFTQTVTRFEQNDPRVTYTGTWYPDTNPLESGGSAVLANLKGSQAIVVFNGTGITWIGESDGYSGLCYLTLDGVQTTVDTGSTTGTTLYQQPLLAVHGLAAGLHRMVIEITHSHDESTDASWIWVDALDIDNGTLVSTTQVAGAGLAQQTDIAANYNGHWFTTNGALYSGGSVNSAVDAGAGVTFTFNGTGVSWIGYRDQWSGLAQVYIDGALQAAVDTYLNPSQAQTTTWSVDGLTPGVHVLDIVATGTKDAASGGAWIWVNGFRVSGSVTAGPPSIGAGGIVNAATFTVAPNNQVSPGQIISVFGQNFTASAGVSATAVPLPTQLAPENVTLTACGRAFPLYSVYPGQINAQLPFECPATGTATATITVAGQAATQTFTLVQASPGIFTVNGSGTGDGVILHADNTLVSAAKPATAGEEVVIYATGLGPTSPSFATGTAANQVNTTAMPVSVTIGGKNATVMYSGLTQGLVGLYQVNAIVPSGTTGSQPVAITVGTVFSSRAGVTMSIQ